MNTNTVTEKIMVVNKNKLIENGFDDSTGFFTENVEIIIETVLSNYFFMERRLCETDPSYKQIIPYAIVKYETNYLLLQRLAGQNEKRLHGMLSVGVGGHINEREKNKSGDILLNGLIRELEEEVTVERSTAPEFLGVLNDATNDVGSVHLGFVYKITADSEFFNINEPDKMTGRWVSIEDLSRNYNEMESWSKLIIKSLTNR